MGRIFAIQLLCVLLFLACQPEGPCEADSSCASGQRCVEGQCVLVAEGCTGALPTRCEGQCVNTRDDAKHCGFCKNACGPGVACKDGRCQDQGEPGGCVAPRPTRCNGRCVDTRTDVKHCGFCDNVCGPQLRCVDGRCQEGSGCSDEKIRCGDECVDSLIDAKHCGGCYRVCKDGHSCDQGSCVASPCGSGLLQCAGACVDPASDSRHCGACAKACAADQLCSGGACVAKGSSGACSDKSLTTCGSACVNTSVDPTHCGGCHTPAAPRACQPPLECRGGQCSCPVGYALCGTSCVDLLADGKHCGACNKACTQGSLCASGRCETSCPKSTPLACAGACVDPQTHARNCGACGTSCGAQQRCVAGKCQCTGGLHACGGRCVDLRADRAHCGGCNKACNAGQLCSEGRCVTGCPTTSPSLCFGGCVDTRNDPQHCGGCGVRCQGGSVCFEGRCQCPPGFRRCDGLCVNTQLHPVHCGACNKACPAGRICSAGRCQPSCPLATPLVCYGGCTDPDANAHHCGGCGNRCGLGGSCEKGRCTCPLNRLNCAGICVDVTQDRLNCGECGQACPQGEVCIEGRCKLCTAALVRCGATCCPDQFSCCGDQCYALDIDRENCGACGNKCPQGQSCCGGQCVDLKTDRLHCGACHTSCPASHRCDTGVCIWQGSIPDTSAKPQALPKAPVLLTSSYNSDFYATAAPDHTITVWNTESGTARFVLKGHTQTITGLQFQPQDRYLASTSKDGSLRIWDLSKGSLHKRLAPANSDAHDVAWSPDGRRLLFGSQDKAIVYDLARDKQLFALPHQATVNELDWSRNGKWLLTASLDKTLKLWQASDGKFLVTLDNRYFFKGLTYHHVRISPDSHFVVAHNGKGTIGAWSLPKGNFVRFGNTNATLFGLEWSPNSKHVLVSEKGSKPSLEIIDLIQFRFGVRIKDIPISQVATSIHWSPDGRLLLYTQGASVMKLGGPRSCIPTKLLRTVPISSKMLRGLAWSPDNKRLAVTSDEGEIHVVDTTNGQIPKSYTADSKIARTVDWSPDGGYLASGGKKVQLWNLATDGVFTIPHGTGSGSTVVDISFSPNGQFLLSVTPSLTIALFNVLSNGTLRSVRTFANHPVSPSKLIVHPNNRWVATGSNILRFYDYLTTAHIMDIPSGYSRGAISFSPDGKTIAGAFNSGKQLRFFSTASGREVRSFASFTTGPNHAVFHPEKPAIATSDGKHILLLDTTTGKLLARLTGHTNNITALRFNPIGNRLASISDKGNLRIWTCP